MKIPPNSYAVIFSSQSSGDDPEGYDVMAMQMVDLAGTQPGFLGVESVRGEDGFGITVSYWESEEAIHAWRENVDHLEAQRLGKDKWYANYQLRIAKIERAYEFG